MSEVYRQLLADEEIPDPALLRGSARDRQAYVAQVERRIFIQECLLLEQHGIHQEAFNIVKRLTADPALQTAVAAILARKDLPEILKALQEVRRDERRVYDAHLETALSRCARCNNPEARACEVRNWRRLCAKCEARLLRRQRTTSTNIRPALVTAKRLKLPATLTPYEWRDAIEHFNDLCAYCGQRWDVVEHATPTERAGGTTRANCLPACFSCNTFKGGKTLEEWLASPRQPREHLTRRQRALDWLVQNGRNPGKGTPQNA